MKITLDNVTYPIIAAIVGFLWLLAYKHPRAYKALAAPIVAIAAVVLMGTFGYLFAWMAFDYSFASYSDIWDKFEGVKEIDPIKEAVGAKVKSLVNPAILTAAVSLSVVLVLAFFGWISRLIHEENASQDAKAEKKEKESES